jgi:hypothetical protein
MSIDYRRSKKTIDTVQKNINIKKSMIKPLGIRILIHNVTIINVVITEMNIVEIIKITVQIDIINLTRITKKDIMIKIVIRRIEFIIFLISEFKLKSFC